MKYKLFTKATPVRLVSCHLCDNNHYEKYINLDGTYYLNCSFTGLSQMLTDQDLISYKVDKNAFLQLIVNSMGIDNNISEIGENLYHLGCTVEELIDFNIYLIFTNEYKKATEAFNTLSKGNNILLWLGTTPHIGILNKNIVSLIENLYVNKGELLINKKPFVQVMALNNSKELESIPIDDNVEIQRVGNKHNIKILANKKLKVKSIISISPQIYKIIKFLYENGAKTAGFTLGEIANTGISSHSRTISSRIKEINDLSDTNKIPPILTKSDDDKWNLQIYSK